MPKSLLVQFSRQLNIDQERVQEDVWPDGYFQDVLAESAGECRLNYPNCHFNIDLGFCSPSGDKRWTDPRSYCYRQYSECWPDFVEPEYSSNGTYHQTITRKLSVVIEDLCGQIFRDYKDRVNCIGVGDDSVTRTHTCPLGECQGEDQWCVGYYPPESGFCTAP